MAEDAGVEFPSGVQEQEEEMSFDARFTAELTTLGGHVFEAPDVASARAYIEKLVAEKGGNARAAKRPAVERLQLTNVDSGSALSDISLGITQADYALADTGTLVVFSEAGEGRALSLLPPVDCSVLES